jgi:hypothetical protein
VELFPRGKYVIGEEKVLAEGGVKGNGEKGKCEKVNSGRAKGYN